MQEQKKIHICCTMKPLLSFNEIAYFTNKYPTHFKNIWTLSFLFSLARNQLRLLHAITQSHLAVVSKIVIFEADLIKLKQAGTTDHPPEIPAPWVIWSSCYHVATCSINPLYLCITHWRLSTKVEESR